MNCCITLSTLVALFVQTPDKFVADRAECGLWEKGGSELMALDMVDFGLFDGSSAVMQSKEALSLKFTHVFCVCRERTGDKVKFCCMKITARWGGRELGEEQKWSSMEHLY